MSKHTPGLWKAIKPMTGNSEVDDHWLDIVTEKGSRITTAYKQDAHLIAAAPELLEACKKMIRTHGMHGPCNQNSCSSCEEAYDKTKQVIAKAGG